MSSPDITSLLSRPIENFINMNVAIMESDKYVDQALEKMKEKGVRSVLVSHQGEVVGIVSKTDILFKVMSQGRNPGKVHLREIMNSPVLAVGPKSSVQETLAMMDKHVVRQLIVTSQSAVLGMHRIEERPVVKDGQIVARPMMYLALSYDHRLIDGREAVTFLVRVKEAIEDPTRLLIDL